MSHSTGKWTSDILHRDYDSVCNGFSSTISNRRSGEISEPVVEGEKIMQVLFSGCDRNIKLGTQCGTCGQWFHNSCGNIKAQVADSGKWICDKRRSERLGLLEEKLQNALLQIDELTRKNRALEEQLRLAAAGRDVAGGIWCWVILKVETVQCWATRLYRMLELNVQIFRLSAFRALERNGLIVLLKVET